MRRAWTGFLFVVILGLGLFIRQSYIDIQNEYSTPKPSPYVKVNPWTASAKHPRRSLRTRPVIPPEPPCDPWEFRCAQRTRRFI